MAPRDVLPGANFAKSIIDAIDSSKAFVLIWTAQANASEHVLNEVCRAFDQRVNIIPLRMGNVQPTRAMAYFLGRTHWLDARTPPLEGALAKLSATIRAILGRQWETVPSAAQPAEVSPQDRRWEETLPPPPATVEPAAEVKYESTPGQVGQYTETGAEMPRMRAPARPRRKKRYQGWMLGGIVLAVVLLLGGLTAAGLLLARGWERVNSGGTATVEMTGVPTSLPAESLTVGPTATETEGPTPSRTPTRTRTLRPSLTATATATVTVPPTATELPATETATETVGVTVEVPTVEDATATP